jgi:hypothetical protein
LCPKATCALVLFALSCVFGDATLILLRRLMDANIWVAFLGFFVVFAAVYAIGLRLILRLRVKPQDRFIGHGGAQRH